VGAKVRVFVRNPDELANERAELARRINKAGTCFLHGTSLSTASGLLKTVKIQGLDPGLFTTVNSTSGNTNSRVLIYIGGRPNR
jgi:hypothetical protein